MEIPRSLRIWFTLHFIVDFAFAIPLFFFPEVFLSFLEWSVIDPFATRIVAAGLFGIGGISFLSRNSGKETFKALLDLKILWSLSSLTAIGIQIVKTEMNSLIWFVSLFFGVFCSVWIYYRMRLK